MRKMVAKNSDSIRLPLIGIVGDTISIIIWEAETLYFITYVDPLCADGTL